MTVFVCRRRQRFSPAGEDFVLPVGECGELRFLPVFYFATDVDFHLFGILLDGDADGVLDARLEEERAFHEVRYSFHDDFDEGLSAVEPLRDDDGRVFVASQGLGPQGVCRAVVVFRGNAHAEVDSGGGDSAVDVDFGFVGEVSLEVFSPDEAHLEAAHHVAELESDGCVARALREGGGEEEVAGLEGAGEGLVVGDGKGKVIDGVDGCRVGVVGEYVIRPSVPIDGLGGSPCRAVPSEEGVVHIVAGHFERRTALGDVEADGVGGVEVVAGDTCGGRRGGVAHVERHASVGRGGSFGGFQPVAA